MYKFMFLHSFQLFTTGRRHLDVFGVGTPTPAPPRLNPTGESKVLGVATSPPPSESSSPFPLQPCVFNLYWQTMKYLQGNSTGNYIKSVWLDTAHPSAAVVGGPPR